MSSRNIAIQREIYEALDKEKRAGESFTSVIRRLLDQKEGLEELVGAWRRASAPHPGRTHPRGRRARP